MTEKRKILLGGEDVSYTLRINARARSVRLCLRSDGNIFVTIPGSAYCSHAEKFLIEKSEWVLKKLEFLKERKKTSLFFGGSENEYKKNKRVAAEIIGRKVELLNREYGFSYKGISVRNQKTRWGSCSVKGALSYNYRIAFLPEKYADYVIVHELCHLKEFNHSRRFWELVEKTIPDYKSIRREMKSF